MKKILTLIFFISCNAFGQTNNSKFVLFANVSHSTRLALTPKGLSPEKEGYIRELKTGLSFDFSAYYVKNEIGYGLKYNVYRSKNERTNPPDFDPILSALTTFSDDITISYIGPTFIYTEGQNAKLGEAFFEISFGYMSYLNNSSFSFERFKIEGGNFGMSSGGGYHFRVFKQFLIGPQVSFVGGTLKRLKFTYSSGASETIELDRKRFENLWRVDFSVSAKFRF